MNLFRNIIGGVAFIAVFFGLPVGLALLANAMGLPARLIGCLALLVMGGAAWFTFRAERFGGHRTGVFRALKRFTFPEIEVPIVRRRR